MQARGVDWPTVWGPEGDVNYRSKLRPRSSWEDDDEENPEELIVSLSDTVSDLRQQLREQNQEMDAKEKEHDETVKLLISKSLDLANAKEEIVTLQGTATKVRKTIEEIEE